MLKIIFWLLALATIIILPIHILNEKGFFKIENVKIEVVSEKNSDEIYFHELTNKLNTSFDKYKNDSLINLKLNEIHKIISETVWIKNYEIRRMWPNTLSVKIIPNQVMFIYWDLKHTPYAIYENNKFDIITNKKIIPDKIHTYDVGFLKDEKLRKKAIDLILNLPEEGPVVEGKIAQIGFNQQSGFWLELLKKQIEVKLGDENINIKLDRVANVLEYLEQKQINARVIDANLNQKVLVRLRKDP